MSLPKRVGEGPEGRNEFADLPGLGTQARGTSALNMEDCDSTLRATQRIADCYLGAHGAMTCTPRDYAQYHSGYGPVWMCRPTAARSLFPSGSQSLERKWGTWIDVRRLACVRSQGFRVRFRG